MSEVQLGKPDINEEIRIMMRICHYNQWHFDIVTASIHNMYDTVIKITVMGVTCFRWNYVHNDKESSRSLCAHRALQEIIEYALMHMREATVKFLKANNQWNGDPS